MWAMEWCPTPDGAPATQYLALACHRGMDDQHCVNQTHPGPGLVQLWDVGTLEYDQRYRGSRGEESDLFNMPVFMIPPAACCLFRPDSQPYLAYGLAQDKGFVWQLKWCPAGGWEPPTCGRMVGFPFSEASSCFDYII